jgi:hypothetical protein
MVYIAGSLTVGSPYMLRRLKRFYEGIAKVVEEFHLDGYLPHQHNPPGSPHTAQEVYLTDQTLVKTARFVIADVTLPSHGVGIEIQICNENEIPVLLLYRRTQKFLFFFHRETRVSRMILGGPYIHKAVPYDTAEEAYIAVRSFLETFTA